MCTVLLPPGVNPTAVNKYMSYHIVSESNVVFLRTSKMIFPESPKFDTLQYVHMQPNLHPAQSQVYCVRNVVAHGDARVGKWRGNWRMEWVASTRTRPRDVVYPALLTMMRTPRLPAVDWTDSPADLNGLVRLGERQNLVSARVPSGSARAPNTMVQYYDIL